MELASYHSSDTRNLEVAPRSVENKVTILSGKCWLLHFVVLCIIIIVAHFTICTLVGLSGGRK